MSTIHQPHDKIVKTSLSNPAVSREFFDRLLPDKIRQLVDLDHLHLENTSFIDDDMKASACDLLFTTKFAGRPGYLYALVEHQHLPDPIKCVALLRMRFGRRDPSAPFALARRLYHAAAVRVTGATCTSHTAHRLSHDSTPA